MDSYWRVSLHSDPTILRCPHRTEHIPSAVVAASVHFGSAPPSPWTNEDLQLSLTNASLMGDLQSTSSKCGCESIERDSGAESYDVDESYRRTKSF